MRLKKGDLVWVPILPDAGIRSGYRQIRVFPAAPAGARQLEITSVTSLTFSARPIGGGPIERFLPKGHFFATAEEATEFAGRHGNERATDLERLADAWDREAIRCKVAMEAATAKAAALRALVPDDASGVVEL